MQETEKHIKDNASEQDFQKTKSNNPVATSSMRKFECITESNSTTPLWLYIAYDSLINT